MSNLNLFMPEKHKTSSSKNDKVATKIRECFSMALARRDFPILPGHEDESILKTYVTITYVKLSQDLRNATVLYVTLNDEYLEETATFFELQKHYFKNLIAKKLKIKYIPDIIFKLDKSIEYSQKIDKVLKEIE
ncbi:MAG: ribosome-binding factor A [Alphaproteobacteria bacterium]|nr:ribosome-binding factor A [Alphaproteobacteria bacterium]